MDGMLKQWVEFQQLRRKHKIESENTSSEFKNVWFIKCSQQIKATIIIDQDEIKIQPDDPDEHYIIILRREHILGCNIEHTRIILNFRKRSSYILNFPTAESHQRALSLIRSVISCSNEGDGSLPETSAPSASSSSDEKQ